MMVQVIHRQEPFIIQMEEAGDTDVCTTDQQMSQETCADDMDTALTATELQSDNPSVSKYLGN
mgnify:FL=1